MNPNAFSKTKHPQNIQTKYRLMVPIIDFRSSTVEKQMHAAYTTCGFAVFTNVFDSWLSEWE